MFLLRKPALTETMTDGGQIFITSFCRILRTSECRIWGGKDLNKKHWILRPSSRPTRNVLRVLVKNDWLKRSDNPRSESYQRAALGAKKKDLGRNLRGLGLFLLTHHKPEFSERSPKPKASIQKENKWKKIKVLFNFLKRLCSLRFFEWDKAIKATKT